MQLNMQREGANSGEFHQTSSSDDGQFLEALRKMMKKEVEVMVINAVHQLVVPTIEDLVRKVMEDKIQSAQSKLLSGGIRNCANEMTVSGERSLQLKFSDEVTLPVLTGKVLKGKTGNPMMVSLIDSTTGEVVDCEPESSAKVEMLLLDANDDDKEINWSVKDFNNRIISEDNKEKPHLAKNEAKYIHLKKGVGTLCKLKLGHGSHWMKSCKCRLAARVLENFRGNEVKEGLTESFVVSDSRSKLYEKHHPPLPSDEVWRLENISKDGAPCQRLNKENIRTVQDFLFLHNVDPQTLQQKFGARSKTWKETVDHARSCTIDDVKLYLHHPCAESKMGVVFDAVGGLKGLVVNQSHYAPIDNLSADEKDCAHKLLLSAFENREERISFDDEASLLHQFPYRPSDINGCDPMIAENTSHYIPTEPGSSSLSITPYMMTSDLHNPSMDTNNWSVPIRLPSFQLSHFENINHYFPTEPAGSSSLSITPYIMTSDLHNPSMDTEQFECSYPAPNLSSQSIYRSGSLESPGTRQLNKSIPRARDALSISPSRQPFSHSENIDRFYTHGEGPGFRSPRSPTVLSGTSGADHDDWSPTSLYVSEIPRGGSSSPSGGFGCGGKEFWVVRSKQSPRRRSNVLFCLDGDNFCSKLTTIRITTPIPNSCLTSFNMCHRVAALVFCGPFSFGLVLSYFAYLFGDVFISQTCVH